MSAIAVIDGAVYGTCSRNDDPQGVLISVSRPSGHFTMKVEHQFGETSVGYDVLKLIKGKDENVYRITTKGGPHGKGNSILE